MMMHPDNEISTAVVAGEALPELRRVPVIEKKIWTRFVRKQMLIYLLTNVLFNSVIPYNSFEHPEAVYLFRGAYCIARFLLPLAFFIPFLVTIDTGNKIRALFRKRSPGFSYPPDFHHNKFLLQQSAICGAATLLLTLGVMVLLQLCIPAGFSFQGLGVSLLLGIYAGAIALYFMRRTINRFRAAGLIDIAAG